MITLSRVDKHCETPWKKRRRKIGSIVGGESPSPLRFKYSLSYLIRPRKKFGKPQHAFITFRPLASATVRSSGEFKRTGLCVPMYCVLLLQPRSIQKPQKKYGIIQDGLFRSRKTFSDVTYVEKESMSDRFFSFSFVAS